MKKHVFNFVLFVTISLQGFAQTNKLPATDTKEYKAMKAAGKIAPGTIIVNTNASTQVVDQTFVPQIHKMAVGCDPFIPGGTPVLPPGDDLSTPMIALPFTFCLYGTNYTSCYINSNGNISFGSGYGAFSSSPFPDPTYVMLAPFWGDADTGGTGSVTSLMFPGYMVVTWDAVGYYSSMTDKVNTFQLIISDGIDPILPAGNNVAFIYQDMQWTTGAASGGVGGFGGTPSTVGVNEGGVGGSFIQIGRFDQPGAAYDGGYGANDGVSWLDNQAFYFNACSGNNITPIVSITPPLVNDGFCDTLRLCGTDDTLIVNALFLSPEIGETTSIAVNTYGTPGFSVLSNIPGNSANAQVQIIASVANAGMQLITFTATDDGVPAQTTTINLNVFIDTTGLAAFNPIVSGVVDFCIGDSTTLTVSPTTFDAYIWNDGTTGFSIATDSTGQYWCTVRENGCYKTILVDVVEHEDPTPEIIGNLFTCFTNNTNLTVDSTSLYPNYSWSNGSTNDSISVLTGTYSVTVTDAFGCTGTSPGVVVMNANPAVSITGAIPFCPEDSITLNAVPTIPSGASYLWSNADNTSSTVVNSSGQVIVTVSYSNGCIAADTINISQYDSPIANFTSNPPGSANPGVTVNFTDLSTIASGTIINWVWNFGDSVGVGSTLQNPSHVYGLDGVYPVFLAVQSNNGCWDTIFFNYEIESTVSVPNIFTPNGDLDNEYLAFKNLSFYPSSALTVFDRWGKKIFTSPDYKNDWKGDGHSDGVYYFILENEKFEGPIAGFVHMIR